MTKPPVDDWVTLTVETNRVRVIPAIPCPNGIPPQAEADCLHCAEGPCEASCLPHNAGGPCRYCNGQR